MFQTMTVYRGSNAIDLGEDHSKISQRQTQLQGELHTFFILLHYFRNGITITTKIYFIVRNKKQK